MAGRGRASAALALASVSLWIGASLVRAAAEGPLLIERHQAAGLDCSACHGDSPSSVPAGVAVCINCHGQYEAIARKTERVAPHNPHQSHEGELECGECHRVHKPSGDYCAQCHQFGFKVP